MLFECEQPLVGRETLRDDTKNGCEETMISLDRFQFSLAFMAGAALKVLV